MSNLRTKGWMVLPIAALVFAALGAVLLARGQLALGQATTTVRIGSGQGVQSTDVTVPLEALDVPAPPGLGAITVDIVYDDSLEPTDWDGSGSPLGMVECNLNSAPYTVTCAGVSTAGVSGDVLIADLTFHLVGETPCIEECDALDVQVVTFADPDGNPIPVTDEDGQICITCPGPGATVYIDPPEKTHYIGCGNISVDVVVKDVANLGAFDVTLGYDDSVVEFAGFVLGPFPEETGRTASCNPPFIQPGSVRVTCYTMDTGTAGPDGSGVLGTFTLATDVDLRLCGNGDETRTSPLDLTNVVLGDILGAPIPTTDEDGFLTVVAIEGDVDNDCDVDGLDIQYVAGRWPCSNDCDPWADLDKDGDIDGLDIQFVAGRWPKQGPPGPDAFLPTADRGEPAASVAN